MAFDDDLARDPKSEKELWSIIEETFAQVKGALTSHDVETREEALTGHVVSKMKQIPLEVRRVISFAIAASVRSTTAGSISLSQVGGSFPKPSASSKKAEVCEGLGRGHDVPWLHQRVHLGRQ
jgi:hypothetical protein